MSLRLFVLALLGVLGCTAAPRPLPLRIPAITAPAGGTAQLKIYSVNALTLVSGELILDFDPTVFGPVTSADVFSSTGDQVGTADIRDRHVDVKFISGTGGIGRLPDLPILTVTIPVLTGTIGTISVKSGPDAWVDAQNVTYTVAATSGSVMVGGKLSVAAVAPGGGLLPTGTRVKLTGTGFSVFTNVTVDGAAVANTQFVSPTETAFTLAAATDLTAKKVVVSNLGDSPVEFISSLKSAIFGTTQPIFPQQLYLAGSLGQVALNTGSVALRNPGLQAVEVVLKGLSSFSNGTTVTATKLTLPPSGSAVVPISDFAVGVRARAVVVPAGPIQMTQIYFGGPGLIPAIPVPVLQPYMAPDTSNRIDWNWKIGTPPPTPAALKVMLTDLPAPFTAGVQSEGEWLSVTPAAGTTCNALSNLGVYDCPPTAKIVVAADPSKLGPGTYNGTVTIMPSVFGGVPGTVPVVLNVAQETRLFIAEYPIINFGSQLPDSGVQNFPLHLTSNADPLPFTVQSDRTWLTVSPSSGVTPATLAARADPATLSVASDTATVTVKSGSTSSVVSFSMQLSTPQNIAFGFSPATVSFAGGTAQGASSQRVSFNPYIASSPFTISSQTDDGGTWLNPSIIPGPGVPGVSVNVNQTGLLPGTYHGTVTVTSARAAQPGQIPVTLLVYGTTPPIQISPKALSFSTTVGGSVSQKVSISTGDVPLLFDIKASIDNGKLWLGASLTFNPGTVQAPTPTTFDAFIESFALEPGVYTGKFTITSPPGSTNSTTLPVTLSVAPRLDPPPFTGTVPMVSMLANSASQRVGGVSPGEITSIFGQNIGGGDTRVLFDGVSAPVLYASSGLVNVVVPYEVGGKAVTNVEIRNGSVSTPAGGIPVVPSAPAVFTTAATGRGQGAILNQDNSLNGAQNAAVRGSIVQIYGTGEGMTSPAGVTGQITDTNLKRPVLPVKVTIGGVEATVLYAGTVPTVVAGLLQVNVVVPSGIVPGASVPVVLTVGGVSSLGSVTIAVR